MTNIEKGAAWVAVVVCIFGAGVGWNSLNNRIDKVDAKISAIQETLVNTPCTAILDRQLAAIDKSRADVRKALDDLSDQYGCRTVRRDLGSIETDARTATWTNSRELYSQLNAVDMG